MFDITSVRKDTPNCEDVLFFDSAGSSLMTQDVFQSIQDYLELEMQFGGYKVMNDQKQNINEFYSEAAKLINTNPRNIAFANNATDGYVKILSAFNFSTRDIIITSENDYVSNIMYFISLKERYGVEIKMIKNLHDGDLDIESFRLLIEEEKPKLVAVTHIPTNSGIIQDVESIGEICTEYDIPFLLDACQSIGQIIVDVKKIKCDFLSVTGRKFLRGPRGTGFIYISDQFLNKGFAPFSVDGWSAQWTKPFSYQINEDATRFEHFEKPYAMMIGLKEAMKYLNILGIEAVEKRNQLLRKSLESKLQEIAEIEIMDEGTRRSNIVTFIKEGIALPYFKTYLEQKNIICSLSGKFSALIDFNKKGIDGAIRLSPHYFNTIEEIETVCEVVSSIK